MSFDSDSLVGSKAAESSCEELEERKEDEVVIICPCSVSVFSMRSATSVTTSSD